MTAIPIYPMSDDDRQKAIKKIEERERELKARGIKPHPILNVAKRFAGTFTYIP